MNKEIIEFINDLSVKIEKEDNISLLKELDKLWCKGDKITYTKAVKRFGYLFRYRRSDVNRLINGNKNLLYPAYKPIDKEDYLAILLYDRFIKTKDDLRSIVFFEKFNIPSVKFVSLISENTQICDTKTLRFIQNRNNSPQILVSLENCENIAEWIQERSLYNLHFRIGNKLTTKLLVSNINAPGDQNLIPIDVSFIVDKIKYQSSNSLTFETMIDSIQVKYV